MGEKKVDESTAEESIWTAQEGLRVAAELFLRGREELAERLFSVTSGSIGPGEAVADLDKRSDLFDFRCLGALRLAESALAGRYRAVPDLGSKTARLTEVIEACSRALDDLDDKDYFESLEVALEQQEMRVSMALQRRQLLGSLREASFTARPTTVPRPWDGLFVTDSTSVTKSGSEMERLISELAMANPSDRYLERKIHAEFFGGPQLPSLPSGSPELDRRWLSLSESGQERILRDARRTLAFWSVAGPAVQDRENRPGVINALTWGLQLDIDVQPDQTPIGRSGLDKELKRLRDLWSAVIARDSRVAFWVADNCFGPASVSSAVEAMIAFARPEREWKAPPGNRRRAPEQLVREWTCSYCCRSYSPGDHSHDSPMATSKISVDDPTHEDYKVYHRVLVGLPETAKPWLRLLALCHGQDHPCWLKGGVLVPVFDD